jgi:hypothetical protein
LLTHYDTLLAQPGYMGSSGWAYQAVPRS